MAAKQIQNARFFNRIDTSERWAAATSTVLGNGELGIVTIGSSPEYILVGDGTTPVSAFVTDETMEYDKQKIYMGKGAQYEFDLIAGDGRLGGIQIKDNSQDSGLIINGEGYLSNAMQNGWDQEEECFIVNKLYIKNLITDEKQEQHVFESDKIILRYNNQSPLDGMSFAGVEVENIDGEGFKGFFGLDNQNRLVVRHGVWDYRFAPVVTITDFSTSGFMMYNHEEADWELGYLKPLSIINGDKTFNYDGTVTHAINVTPPTIILNSQTLTYDSEKNSYTGEFVGGLTTENKEAIDKAIADSAATAEELTNVKAQMLTSETITLTPGTNITIDTNSSTGRYNATVNHSTITTTTNSTASESIKVDSDKSFSFITGITVDNGHVTSVTISSYKFVS